MAGRLGAPRVLVADDDPEFGYMLACWLERHGYVCVRAKDAADAVLALRAERIDLVISDIDMPGNQGLSLVKYIASLTEGPPVILLTGKPSFETAVDAVGSPVAAYLVKPVDNERLAAQIESVLAAAAANRIRRAEERRWREGLAALAACEARLQAGEAEAAVRSDLLKVLHGFSVPPEGAEAGRMGLLEQALKETIDVLEDSRKTFKSRQLAELRRRLLRLA